MTSYCGDGAINGSEMCDDGNAVTEACAYNSEGCTVCNETVKKSPAHRSFVGMASSQTAKPATTAITSPKAASTTKHPCRFNSVCQLEAGAVRVCGDGRVDLGFETCDDGNANTEYCSYNEESCIVGDAASRTYVEGERSYCGDGLGDRRRGLRRWQLYGICRSGDGLQPATTQCCGPYCGDGVVQFPETCDDPNDVDCNAWCHYGPEEMMFIPEGPFFMGCKDQFDPADCETEAGCEPSGRYCVCL